MYNYYYYYGYSGGVFTASLVCLSFVSFFRISLGLHLFFRKSKVFLLFCMFLPADCTGGRMFGALGSGLGRRIHEKSFSWLEVVASYIGHYRTDLLDFVILNCVLWALRCS